MRPATAMISTLALETWWTQKCWASRISKVRPRTAASTQIPAWPLEPGCCSRAGWGSRGTDGCRSTTRTGRQKRTMGNCTCRRATRLPSCPVTGQTAALETWVRSHPIQGTGQQTTSVKCTTPQGLTWSVDKWIVWLGASFSRQTSREHPSTLHFTFREALKLFLSTSISPGDFLWVVPFSLSRGKTTLLSVHTVKYMHKRMVSSC